MVFYIEVCEVIRDPQRWCICAGRREPKSAPCIQLPDGKNDLHAVMKKQDARSYGHPV